MLALSSASEGLVPGKLYRYVNLGCPKGLYASKQSTRPYGSIHSGAEIMILSSTRDHPDSSYFNVQISIIGTGQSDPCWIVTHKDHRCWERVCCC